MVFPGNQVFKIGINRKLFLLKRDIKVYMVHMTRYTYMVYMASIAFISSRILSSVSTNRSALLLSNTSGGLSFNTLLWGPSDCLGRIRRKLTMNFSRSRFLLGAYLHQNFFLLHSEQDMFRSPLWK